MISTCGRMEALETLAMMPLLTRDELAAVCRRNRTSVGRTVNGLAAEHIIEGTRYKIGGYKTERWRLTEKGVKVLSESWGVPMEDLLRKWPLSAEWEQSLLRRVQTVAICYRIARGVAESTKSNLQWRWERADVFDAFMGLGDGRTVGICRMGTALSTKAITSRLNSVQLLSDLRQVVAALLIVPGPIERERAMRRFDETGVNVAVGIEQDVMEGVEKGWQMTLRPSAGNVSLSEFTSSVLKNCFPDRRREPVRAAPPRGNETRGGDAPELLMTRISHNGNRLFDLVSDWPLIEEGLAQEMLDVGGRRFSELKKEAVDAGILVILKFPSLRRGGRTRAPGSRRMALTNHGLRHLAWRDRVRLSELLKGWKIFEDPAGNIRPRINGYRLEGTKIRVLARELRHTYRIHGIIRAIQAECAASDGDYVEEILPPHRWERWFYYNRRRYGIRPDATVLIKCNGRRRVWLIEYEQRAKSPKQMVDKMQRYLRYFGSLDTVRDFEIAPTALIVFPERGASAKFAVTARRSVGRTRFGRNPRLRLLVSNVEDIDARQFMGQCWLDPWNLDSGAITPSDI